MKRTQISKTPELVGQQVLLKGWINSRRDHGQIVFLDLRDRSGLIQIIAQKDVVASPEDVVEITGLVKSRPDHLINPDMSTGSVELEAKEVKLVNSAQTLPFPIDTSGLEIGEDTRLKYRYLDLRRQRLLSNLTLRHQTTLFLRNWLSDQGFLEIETPILTKTTPEGARDFLVPSRLQTGSFYALPQSPQQYKQLLMVAGIEKYFQFARCFRDEDPRADRAYGEFTQLDMEMSFITQEDILELVELMFTALIKAVFPDKHIQESPWPRLSHQEAIQKYNSDKPDLRKDTSDKDSLAFAWILEFPLFTKQSQDDYFHGSGQARFAPSHHMFTAPHPDDVSLLDTDPLKVRGLQHDLVLNGLEVGGGSIRIHDPGIQQKVFDLIGFNRQQQAQFQHLLTAFSYGVPPHGGIAPGLDRLLMAILGEPSLREVIAFPAVASGRTAVVDAPSPASPHQLQELGIATLPAKDQS